jgi:membrane protease YdiL (CAAX protease family)
LAILLLKERSKDNFLRVLFFALIYVIYQIALSLPSLSKSLNFIESSWNWEGKIFGILFGIICYFLFRKYFSDNDFFTFRQNQEGFRKALAVAIFIVVLATTIAFLTGSSKFNLETLAFQLTMPGIDEEIMFRGILLGLLASSLKPKFAFLGNPAVLLNAILFGLMHALTLDKNNSLDFEPIYFLQTAIGGYAWAWITIKSRSILLAILSHNFSNFFAAASTMLK